MFLFRKLYLLLSCKYVRHALYNTLISIYVNNKHKQTKNPVTNFERVTNKMLHFTYSCYTLLYLCTIVPRADSRVY